MDWQITFLIYGALNSASIMLLTYCVNRHYRRLAALESQLSMYR